MGRYVVSGSYVYKERMTKKQLFNKSLESVAKVNYRFIGSLQSSHRKLAHGINIKEIKFRVIVDIKI